MCIYIYIYIYILCFVKPFVLENQYDPLYMIYFWKSNHKLWKQSLAELTWSRLYWKPIRSLIYDLLLNYCCLSQVVRSSFIIIIIISSCISNSISSISIVLFIIASSSSSSSSSSSCCCCCLVHLAGTWAAPQNKMLQHEVDPTCARQNVRPFFILIIVRTRIFEPKLWTHSAKKLDGTLRKPTSFVWEFVFLVWKLAVGDSWPLCENPK